MSRPRLALLMPAVAAAALACPQAAGAHAFSTSTDQLPVPSWLFAWAAVIVLVVSFFGLALLWQKPKLEGGEERLAFRVPRVLEALAGAIGIVLFVVVVYAGLAGT